MKKLVMLLAVFALMLPAAFGFADAGAETTQDSQVLTGEYLWEQREITGPVEATFESTGEGTWNVSFRFTFRSEDHTYSGTAEGSLSDGPLSGTVKNESKKRSFTIEGQSEAGTFTGEHAEHRDGKVVDTGSITLKG